MNNLETGSMLIIPELELKVTNGILHILYN